VARRDAAASRWAGLGWRRRRRQQAGRGRAALRRVARVHRGAPQRASEKDAKLAQKLDQLQPFIAMFPRQCMPAYFEPNLTPFSLQESSALSEAPALQTSLDHGIRRPRQGRAASWRSDPIQALDRRPPLPDPKVKFTGLTQHLQVDPAV
jgi:hypothetical protein